MDNKNVNQMYRPMEEKHKSDPWKKNTFFFIFDLDSTFNSPSFDVFKIFLAYIVLF